MMINYAAISQESHPNFLGGEKSFEVKMFKADGNKIMECSLKPGASIGAHRHVGECEIYYFLSGQGTVSCDGVEEKAHPGLCHYCPKDSMHGILNDGTEELRFFAMVAKQ